MDLMIRMVDPVPWKVVIVYRSSLFCDVVIGGLANHGIGVLAAIRDTDVTSWLIRELDPDVFVLENGLGDQIGAALQATVLSPKAEGKRRMMVIGDNCLVSVDYYKEIIQDASFDDFLLRIQDIAAIAKV